MRKGYLISIIGISIAIILAIVGIIIVNNSNKQLDIGNENTENK